MRLGRVAENALAAIWLIAIILVLIALAARRQQSSRLVPHRSPSDVLGGRGGRGGTAAAAWIGQFLGATIAAFRILELLAWTSVGGLWLMLLG